MAEQTTNYNLTKPLESEKYSVLVFNSNADIIDDTLFNKVDKISGMGLSTNDYTNGDKAKLEGVATGAEVNVQSDWNVNSTSSDAFIKNKPTSLSQFSNESTNYLNTIDDTSFEEIEE